MAFTGSWTFTDAGVTADSDDRLFAHPLQHGHTLEESEFTVHIHNYSLGGFQHAHTLDGDVLTVSFQPTPLDLQHTHTIEGGAALVARAVFYAELEVRKKYDTVTEIGPAIQ